MHVIHKKVQRPIMHEDDPTENYEMATGSLKEDDHDCSIRVSDCYIRVSQSLLQVGKPMALQTTLLCF